MQSSGQLMVARSEFWNNEARGLVEHSGEPSMCGCYSCRASAVVHIKNTSFVGNVTSAPGPMSGIGGAVTSLCGSNVASGHRIF